MPPVLEFANVCVDRRGTRVLNNVSLAIDQGEFVALIGSNGSGKTTVLRTIMGFLRPTSGAVRLFGRPAWHGRMARKRIGYVPQSLSIDFRMPITVRDVVAMGRYGLIGLARRPGDTDRHAIEQALDEVHIDALADRPIGHLSGGELQKVQIARALCQRPALLLLDEPTSNLDLGAQRECLDLIGHLHSEHDLTTFLVMHDLKSLPAGCSRALILNEARIVFDGKLADAFTEEMLSHVYREQGAAILRELVVDTFRGGRPG